MVQHISQEGLDLIKSCEGCRLTAYKAVPTEKYYTIGWGHYGEEITKDTRITQAEADSLLMHDLEKYEHAVTRQKIKFPAYQGSPTQLQFDGLVSFAYNCGCSNLTKLCKNRTIEEIQQKIMLYNKSGGKVLSGLTKRREAERNLLIRGTQTIDQIVDDVLNNKYGSGSKRIMMLENAGYIYNEVQKAVNERLKND